MHERQDFDLVLVNTVSQQEGRVDDVELPGIADTPDPAHERIMNQRLQGTSDGLNEAPGGGRTFLFHILIGLIQVFERQASP